MSRSEYAWDAAGVRALRQALGLTQQELADELGVRQQTVSEWETGMYRPRGASVRMLRHVAERRQPYHSPLPNSVQPEAHATTSASEGPHDVSHE